MRDTNVSPGPILGAILVSTIVAAWWGAIDRSARAQGDDAGAGIAWEYKQETSVPVTDAEVLDGEVLEAQRRMLELNGRDGWELACTHTFPLSGGQRGGQGQGTYGVVYVFKRPLR